MLVGFQLPWRGLGLIASGILWPVLGWSAQNTCRAIPGLPRTLRHAIRPWNGVDGMLIVKEGEGRDLWLGLLR